MRKYLVELIGTFFLVATIGCTVLPGAAGVIPPLAIGAVLMVMIYAGGHVSGGHYNPAVTLGVWLRGRCETKDLISYWVAQFAGGAVAAVAAMYLTGITDHKPTELNVGRALLGDFMYTFALVYVVLNVVTAKATSGNSYFGLAIGFTVVAGAFAVGAISGAAFNPAVAVGATLMGLIKPGQMWIHLVGDFAGGATAAYVFKYINPNDK
ncbi:MAG: MIP family channel protein [Isosphaeraceae bacterium]